MEGKTNFLRRLQAVRKGTGIVNGAFGNHWCRL